jgi:2-methylcitrate dehydratase PrpD
VTETQQVLPARTDAVGATVALARFISDTTGDTIPRPVWHQAKRCLVDWLGVALLGSTHPGAAVLSRVSAGIAEGQGTVLGQRQRLPYALAALVNGYQSHVMDYDDTYNPARTTVHGNSPVWPAAFAMAESRGASGAEVMAAFILGWETQVRIARAAGPYHYDIGWHVTGTVGHFGAAAAAARLLGLDAERTVNALGTAGTQSAGLKQVYGSMGKAFHPGKAAFDGFLSAILAEEGFTSNDAVLEGPVGFWNVLSKDADPSFATDGLGDTWELPNDGFKAYACGSLMHATIDSIIELRRRHQIAPDEVVSIEPRAPALLSWVMAKVNPRTGLDGKFSSTHCAAVAMVDGAAGINQFTDERVVDPIVAAMRERVEFDYDESLPKDAAAVTIRLRDGRVLTHETPHNRGTPANPMSDDELSAKFVELASIQFGAARSGELLDRLWRFDEIEDVRELIASCAATDG